MTMLRLTLLFSLLVCWTEAFVPTRPIASSRKLGDHQRPTFARSSCTSLRMIEISDLATQSSLVLAETEPWVQPLSLVLDPFLNLLSFGMLCRVVLSWYPTTNVNELPWAAVAWPTEPFLRAIRGVVPPAFGVDITPIVWLGVFTFLHEILLGQQGFFTMKIKYGI
eukprot:CAMPEP_0194046464 /NCGR_PEP_ID=MMETSP0009_2-20130614/21128_1 /TAXON_ID=210454 /ORGANISM="Grammatophora oceanica, Strain CCMP 410" /LENGTH=165 /DNA_ID=CAMNT_0038691767 /DNA_START=62 /DNA_END=559 /DNA_ORIENTATION=+